MSALDERTLQTLIDQIYDAALEPHRWNTFLETLNDLFRARSVLFVQDLRHGDSTISLANGFEEDRVRSYVEYYGYQNVWLPYMAPLPAGTLIVSEAFAEKAGYEKTEYFNDWAKPQGLYYALGAIVQKDGGVATNLSIDRSHACGPATEQELHLIARLVPHLQRAVRMHLKLSAAQLARDGATQAIEGLSTGVILVDRSARILFANALAEHLMREESGIHVRQGRLRATRPRAAHELEKLIAHAVDTAAGKETRPGGVLRVERRAGAPLSVLVCPLRPGAGTIGLAVPAALVLVSDGAAATRVPVEIASKLYGLSTAEAALLAALVEGERLQDHAEHRRITLATAKTQLRSIFAKTGQERQSDLIRLVLTNPVALAGGALLVGER